MNLNTIMNTLKTEFNAGLLQERYMEDDCWIEFGARYGQHREWMQWHKPPMLAVELSKEYYELDEESEFGMDCVYAEIAVLVEDELNPKGVKLIRYGGGSNSEFFKEVQDFLTDHEILYRVCRD